MSASDSRAGAELFAPLPESITDRPAEAEEAVLAVWREQDAFGAVQAARAGAPAFVFWEGPPTANGRPGIHHVLARTIKDTVCRFHTMLGKRVVRKAGWDTHGLPVELEVEKALGISGKPEIEKHGVASFNAKCRESVWTYRKEWEEISERIGYWLDYEHPYVTYDEDYVESVWNLLKRFHDAGLVYLGNRILPYCGRCGTGLSSHELGQPGVYRDIKDPSVTLRFRRAEAGHEDESILAWTTTPWTLPSNFGLAVNPDVTYVKARVARGDETELVWLAEARAEAVLGADHEVLDRKAGAEMVGWTYKPLFLHPRVGAALAAGGEDVQRWYRVHAADFVTTEDGTGIVHQAPYGADDFALAKREGIDTAPFMGVGADGRFQLDVGAARQGTFFRDANDALTDDLKQRGLLFKKAKEPHSYPHCWRCDTPLFYFPAPAWYIRTTAYKDRMIELNRKIRWVPPEVGEKRFGEWLENNVDWNISRDRYWGTPLPFWVCGAEGCETQVAIGSVAELRERAGSLPEGFDNHKPLIDGVTFPCPQCGGTMRRTPSVLDCWFDSGAMPYAQYHWPFEGSEEILRDQYPADFIAEGLDQTRGWFYTLHAIGAFVTDPKHGTGLPDGPTYKTCVVNGLVLDKDGVKMSKRLGNVVNPREAVGQDGADSVRWYSLSSGSPWLPKRFDPKGPGEVRRRFFGTLLNSYGFFALYARLEDGYRPGDAPAALKRPEIDRWLISRTHTVAERVRASMEAYDLAGSCRLLERFVVDEMSNWYIRRNRRRFWKGGAGSDKAAAFATLHEALRAVSVLIAPFAPFTSELLWERLDGRGSVHAQLVPEPVAAERDAALEESMADVARVVEMGRALRERIGVKIRQPLSALHVRSSDARALELLRTPFATGLVLDELNVKAWGSLAADDGELCTLTVKPNFRVLGKRLGPRMKQAGAALAGLSQEDVARLRDGGEVSLDVGGERETLGPDDVLVAVETHADFDVEADGRFVVYFDTELTPELRAEGLAREVVNRVNGLRKTSGLAVEDRIRLGLDPGGSELLARAIEEFADLIRGETLAVELELRAKPLAGAELARFELGEEHVLTASLARA